MADRTSELALGAVADVVTQAEVSSGSPEVGRGLFG